MKLEVLLPDGLSLSGAVLVHQLKSLAFESRRVQLIERAPQAMVEKVTELVTVITQ